MEKEKIVILLNIVIKQKKNQSEILQRASRVGVSYDGGGADCLVGEREFREKDEES